MNSPLVISHFFEPNWPLVNKISAITKCLNVEMIHCSSRDKLDATTSSHTDRRILFFTDEGLIDKVSRLENSPVGERLEVAMFIHSPLLKLAEKFTSLTSVKYLIGAESTENFGRDLSILIKKFADENILDLDKYLAFGCNVITRTVTSYDTKRSAVDAVNQYINNLGGSGYAHPFGEYARRVSEIVDELLINAIYDANPRMQGVDRSKKFQLNESEKIQVSWGYDGEYFGVSVRDPFGKFTCDTIMRYLASQKADETITLQPSAGIGLKLIFEKAHKVITNVQKESVTEVIVLVRFESRMLEFERRKKSFYYFENGDKKTVI